MKNFFKNYAKDSRGATAVEFSLVALPFIVMMFGIIEAGRLAWTMNGVQYAIEETSRYASLNASMDSGSLEDYAQNKLQGMMIMPAPLQLSSSTVNIGGVQFVEIAANYRHDTLIGDMLLQGFGSITLDANARKPIVN